MKYRTCILFLNLFIFSSVFGNETVDVEMSPETLLLHYSQIEAVEYKGTDAIHLRNTPAKRDGAVAFIKDIQFEDGIIEVDIASERFAGIAFRARNSDHYDKLYFRPFNSGTEKHQNSVQYAVGGNKEYSWKSLRDQFPGKYESGADLPVFEWFTAKLVIQGDQLRVFVDDGEEPVLVVEQLLSGNQTGSIGIWGWNAYFSNFRYTPL